MAVVYSDTFSSRTPNAFWNSSSGVTFTGTTVSIAANGNYLGSNGVATKAAFREIVFQVTAGDRPGTKLYGDGIGEIFSITAVPASNSIDVYLFGSSYRTWTYTGTHTWWRFRWDGSQISFETSSDGSTFVLVGTVPVAGSAVAINEIYINAAGNGVGTGTSRVATVVDNFTWQDYIFPITSTAVVIDDAQRANENPLSNGGMWDSPGLVDGHTALQILNRTIAGNTGTDSALLRTSYRNQEIFATLAADSPSRSEPTVFACMQADPKNGYVFWTNTVSEYYVGRFDAGAFTGLQPNIPTPGGSLLAGDRIHLFVIDGYLIPAIYRAATRTLTAVTRIADSTYRSGLPGLGAINGVTYSNFGITSLDSRSEAVPIGGAIAGGTAPRAIVSTPAGSALAQTTAPRTAAIVVRQFGAVANGVAPIARATVAIGGALAGTTAIRSARATVDRGGALAGGTEPAVNRDDRTPEGALEGRAKIKVAEVVNRVVIDDNPHRVVVTEQQPTIVVSESNPYKLVVFTVEGYKITIKED